MADPSPAPARLNRTDTVLTVLVGLAATTFYMLTANHTLSPDAVAYADMVRNHDLFHPQHLLHNVLFVAGWKLQGGDRPELAMNAINAIGGGLGIGLAWRWMVQCGSDRRVALAGATLLATAYGWWSLSTSPEVHVLPLAVQIGATLLALRGRGVAAGVVAAAAILLHKTMVLALPALLLGTLMHGRRAATRLALVVSLLVGGVYGIAIVGDQHRQGTPWVGVATAWILAEVATTPGELDRPDLALRASAGASGSWIVTSPPRCAFNQEQAAFPLSSPQARQQVWRRARLGAIVGSILALVGLVVLARRDRGQALALAGWPLLAVPAAVWFEPQNHEYYLGPLTCAVVLSAVGATWLARRVSGGPWIFAAAGLVVAALVGRHNHQVDIGPAMLPEQGYSTCSGSKGPPPPRGNHQGPMPQKRRPKPGHSRGQ